MSKPKVFVSGCFDMLHSGHVRFLEEASAYGDLHVGVGSDETVRQLKGRYPVNPQEERKYMLESLKYVKACYINRGSGIMDFVHNLKLVAPDVMVVNEDGNTPAKAQLCRKLGIQYVVLERKPRKDLPSRSTTSLRKECSIPYRLDLAGGWLDQPFVSKFCAGPVLTISIEPTIEFNERSGMASSSRRRAIELWQTDIPGGDKEKLARMLFSFENPPGTMEFSGSQDSIGIVYPGLNRLDYDGDYWPGKITSVYNEKTLQWIEDRLHLIALGPRKPSYHALHGRRITREGTRLLAQAAEACWKAILQRNEKEFGLQVRRSFEAQVKLFPSMVDANVKNAIEEYSDSALGWKLSGAGGGGYLVLISDKPVPGALKLKIRRKGH